MRVSVAVGSTPVVSRNARRINSESEQRGDGGRFRLCSFSNTRSSMKLRRLARVKSLFDTLLVYGTVMVPISMRLRYQAVIAPSPKPTTLACPLSSTWDTVSFADEYFA